MEKKKIILDCDPGSDDAIAIMLALYSEAVELLAITTVNGNRIVPKTTENALRVVEYLGAKVPVYRGCEEPIFCNQIPSRKPNLPRITLNDCHGDFLPMPPATIKPQKEHAVFYLVDAFNKADRDITLVTVGPLTNIAMALRIDPSLEDKIKEMVIMGGGHTGANASAAAEFNFYADPEAAKIVMDTKIPKTILPLDATWRACITDKDCEKLTAMGTKAAIKTAELTMKRIANLKVNDVTENNYELRHRPGSVGEKVLYRYENNMAPIHDALAVAYVIDPSVLTELADANVDIDTSCGICDGRMVADFHNTKKGKAPVTAKVALNSDGRRFAELLFHNFVKKELDN